MPPGREDNGSAAYRPTSLDYINLPNPIEPHAQSQKHPLNGTPRLEKARLEAASNQDLFKLLLEPAVERPAKRQKPSDNALLDLPKLPVRNATKRLRIPPTLSGLHQPPPDAGLLPSISVEQPQVPPLRHTKTVTEVATKAVAKPRSPARAAARDDEPAAAPGQSAKSQQKRPKRNKWTDEETECLLKGAARFGIGSWTKILKCPDYEFNKRTALDLKDRFRVLRPDDYKSSKASEVVPDDRQREAPAEEGQPAASKPKTSRKGPAPENVSSSKLKELGINEPFVKTGRRSRHGYSEAEDEALLTGFKKYGNSWSAIRSDPAFGLSSRKATDLRDRFRTRYSEEYAKTGLALRTDKSPGVPKRVKEGKENATVSEGESAAKPPKAPTPTQTSAMPDIINKEEPSTAKPAGTKRPLQPLLFSLDDIYLGVPFGNNDYGEREQIVLDRRILDWPSTDAPKAAPAETSKSHGIDPLKTLNLPKPVSAIPSCMPSLLPSAPANASNALPSLASLMPDVDTPDQLELPSMMQWFGATDNDGKTTIPSLDDLLS